MTDDYLARLATFDRQEGHCLRELRTVARELHGKPWVSAKQHSPAHFKLKTNNPSLAATFLICQASGGDATLWRQAQRRRR
jgi:hypothetical protein